MQRGASATLWLQERSIPVNLQCLIPEPVSESDFLRRDLLVCSPEPAPSNPNICAASKTVLRMNQHKPGDLRRPGDGFKVLGVVVLQRDE